MKIALLVTAGLASGAIRAAGAKFDILENVISYNLDEGNAESPQIGASLEEENGEINSISQLSLMKTKTVKNVKKNQTTYDFHVFDNQFPYHKLRIKSTAEDLGIDTVKQYTGYLDVEDQEEDADADSDKHFFYWFFESRNDPANDPLILWLNGGPGVSSMTGLFFELGPSSIDANLTPVFNPQSWNNNASVIFLDQPVNVGFSYSGRSVTNTAAAAKDVYALLELFFKKFPQYQKLDFHIAGESYAGHYIPAFASEIMSHPDRSINLKSVLIGNGMTDPLTQYQYYRPMACGEGGEPSVLSNEKCDKMEASIASCVNSIKACYKLGSPVFCVPATIYCRNSQINPFHKTGRNQYDMRIECKGSSSCYEELQYLEDYLNIPEVQDKLGVEVEEYVRFNKDISKAFYSAGYFVEPHYKNVIELLDSGLPVLIYAGDKDFACNWLGNQAWTNKLPWSGHREFDAQPIREWSVNCTVAGEVKNYKHFTFLRVFGAGHMVPFDQPENSLDMVNRWISGNYQF